MIHATAVIDPTAEISADAEVGPFCVVMAHARVEDGCQLLSHVVVGPHTQLGRGNVLHPGSVLGGAPQDKSYRGEPTKLLVGEGNCFREGVTISRGTMKGGGVTRLGHRNLLMANSHLGHDCSLGDDNILANNVLLAGHVEVGDRVVLSGSVACHHFVRIGSMAYVGGLSRIVHDVPPFVKVSGDPGRVRALNRVGLVRSSLATEEIAALESAFLRLFRAKEPLAVALQSLASPESELVATLVRFLHEWRQSSTGRYLEQFRKDR